MNKLLLLMLMFAGFVNAQIVNIPDANFKARLLEASTENEIAKDIDRNRIKIDLNGDEEIQESEALVVTSLDVDDSSISDLTGISFFVNLEDLTCSHNLLKTLDVRKNLNLEFLNCSGNRQLISLDITKNVNLEELRCSWNKLTSLDITKNLNLETLKCSMNKLTSLDVTKNKNLVRLICNNTELTNLDVNTNSALEALYCGENEFLNTLNIKNGSLENIINFENNPNLAFICVDEDQLEIIQEQAGDNVLVSSYCSFIPGGDYNTISGNTRFNADSDMCSIEGESTPFIKIAVNDGTTEEFIFANALGDFSLYTNIGSYTLSPVIENLSWFTISPSSINVNLVDENTTLENQDFCIVPNGIHNDLEIVISPMEVARPGFDAVYRIIYKNKGNQPRSGAVDFVFDDTVLDYVSASLNPDSQSIGNLSWNYTNLLPFESKSIEVTLNVNSPMESPAVNNDDVLNFTATISPVSEDELPTDNVFQFNQTVVGSFDPNDITCLEGDVVEPSMIGEYLHYLINFENTGTASATFIIVKDIVDVAKYDMSSIQILEASHSMETKIIDNKVEFIFDAINLGASEKGYVVFKIKSLNTLVLGDAISKKADIYFDYNFPIETNLATTSFENLVLSNAIFEIDHSVSVFPNPSKDILHVNAESSIKSIEMYDIQGRIVLAKRANDKDLSIHITNFTRGVYFLKVQTEVGEKLEKIVKN